MKTDWLEKELKNGRLSVDDLISNLELYEGRWSLQVKENLFVFPADTTRAQAEKVLRQIHAKYVGVEN